MPGTVPPGSVVLNVMDAQTIYFTPIIYTFLERSEPPEGHGQLFFRRWADVEPQYPY